MQVYHKRPHVSTPVAVRARGDQGAFGGGARRAGHRRVNRRGQGRRGPRDRARDVEATGRRFGGEARAFRRDGRGGA
ncbi:MAG: hypothetical protein LBU32_15420 [Clostridiales bacterium]|nr:hypothetical protein [Clostridiales bacterium]